MITEFQDMTIPINTKTGTFPLTRAFWEHWNTQKWMCKACGYYIERNDLGEFVGVYKSQAFYALYPERLTHNPLTPKNEREHRQDGMITDLSVRPPEQPQTKGYGILGELQQRISEIQTRTGMKVTVPGFNYTAK